MIDSLLAYVAPHPCYGCMKSGSILCESCVHDISEEPFGRCIWCLAPTTHDEQCHPCSRRLGVKAAWAVGARRGPLERVINAYKYESAREAARVFEEMLDSTIALLPEGMTVTTVPTATNHIRQRGFDHVELFGRRFAERRTLPFTSLLGRRHNVAQHTLTRSERLKQAREAFVTRDTPMPQSVLLIDDILTTGATLETCVALLKGAGVRDIYVAIVARQLFSEIP